MFEIGDKVVYPMQGIGVIQDIQEKEFSGKKQLYYIIKMITSNLKVMLPFKRIEPSNLRLISDESTLENVLSDFSKKEDWNSDDLPPTKQRYKDNLEKVKSGSFKKSAEVFYDLTCLNKEKPLSSNEKQMLSNTHKFLVNEITLIKQITENEAEDLLNECIN